MKSQLLVTATGEDRPGLVARMTEVFLAHGANLEESRMALLGGEFAAIMLLSVPDSAVDALGAALSSLKEEGITVSSKRTKPLSAERFKHYVPYELTVSGADHEGIVHKVSKFLRDQSVNIQSMESSLVSAPVTGTPLFCLRATVAVPPSLGLAELRRQLASIGEEESVQIEVTVPAAS